MKRKIMKGLASALALCLAFSMALPVGAKDLSLNSEVKAAVELCEEAGGTLLFEGGSNESYESSDASWLMNAKDDEVITVVYTCTDETHAGWGVLGWGATVNDVWTDGPSLSASEKNASDEMVATVTVAEMKKVLKITDGAVVSFIKLGAWNGGKIISLTISSADAAPKVEGAEEIVIEAPKDLNPEDYLHIFEGATEWPIYIGEYLPYYNPGQTISMTIELEGNGPFSGGLGICVNQWAWQQQEFASDSENKCTVEVFITPLQDNFYFGMWYVGGTQVGVKSITIEKAIDYSDPAAVPEEPAREPYEGNANASFSGYVDMADASWWTEKELTLAELIGNVDPATVTSIVFNGETSFTIGYNSTSIQDATTGSAWKQAAGLTHTVTDVYLVDDPADTIDFTTKICLSKGNSVEYRITWDVYTNGATPAVDPSQGQQDPNKATVNYTLVNGETVTTTFDPADKIAGLTQGDQVKVTVKAEGDPSTGWYGYSFNVGTNSGADSASCAWTQIAMETWSMEDLTKEMTVTLPYPAGNSIQVQSYSVQGSDIQVTITLEKIQ